MAEEAKIVREGNNKLRVPPTDTVDFGNLKESVEEMPGLSISYNPKTGEVIASVDPEKINKKSS